MKRGKCTTEKNHPSSGIGPGAAGYLGGRWGGAGAAGPVIPAPVGAGKRQVLRGPVIPAPVVITPLLLALAILNPHDLLCLTLYECINSMMWWVKDSMAWYLLDLAPALSRNR